MSRRNSATVLHVGVTLECANGHDLGSAYLMLPPHPRAGRFGLEASLSFEDHDGKLGGKVKATCARCGLVEQVAWRRVHDRLRELHAAGRHAGVLRIHD